MFSFLAEGEGRTAGAILSTSFRDEENWAGKKGRAAQNSTLLYFPPPPSPVKQTGGRTEEEEEGISLSWRMREKEDKAPIVLPLREPRVPNYGQNSVALS